MKKATDEQLIAAYEQSGSVWKAARLLGMCGQSVHERLKKLGSAKPINAFTDQDRERLKREYEGHAAAGTLDHLASQMGRTKQFICRQAKRLGLTSPDRPKPYLAEQTSAAMKEWHRKNDHPRGMKGKRHSSEARETMHVAQKARWDGLTQDQKDEMTMRQAFGRRKKGTSTPPENRGGATWKAGWRVIGPHRKYYRSMWEANYARYLEWLRERGEIQFWEHEPTTFWFDGIKRGVMSYKPDFRVIEKDGRAVWHEVKGWMDARSKTTLSRMKKYHPSEVVIVIDGPQIKAIDRKVSHLILGWERKDGTVNDNPWIGRRIFPKKEPQPEPEQPEVKRVPRKRPPPREQVA